MLNKFNKYTILKVTCPVFSSVLLFHLYLVHQNNFYSQCLNCNQKYVISSYRLSHAYLLDFTCLYFIGWSILAVELKLLSNALLTFSLDTKCFSALLFFNNLNLYSFLNLIHQIHIHKQQW